MADTVEQHQSEQSRRIAGAIIAQSEAHQQKMQSNWEKAWRAAHISLAAILRALDPEYDEACVKAGRPLELLDDADLFYLAGVRIRALQELAGRNAAPQKEIENRQRTEQQLQELKNKYEELEHKYLVLETEARQLQDEKNGLQIHLDVVRQVQANTAETQPPVPIPDMEVADIPAPTPEPLPDWVAAWKNASSFSKMAVIVRVMGERGMSLRPHIEEEVAHRLHLSEDNSGISTAIKDMIEAQKQCPVALIEKVEGSGKGSSAGGKAPDILRLTPDGRLAYRVLSGREARENEYDVMLLQHASPDHTVLNIYAASVLHQAGYEIRGVAQKINLPGGETFIPDIVAADPKTGELIFVEVECDTRKDKQTRKQKWINVFRATNGNIYVFCDNLNCQRNIVEELNRTLGSLRYNSFVTNLYGLWTGQVSKEDGGIWLSSVRMNSRAHRSPSNIPVES